MKKNFIALFILCMSPLTSSTCYGTDASSSPSINSNKHDSTARRGVAIVYSFDGVIHQPSIDFYRAVYRVISQGNTWDALPMASVQYSLTQGSDGAHLGGIPVIDRSAFRKGLPRKSTKHGKVKLVPGTPTQEIQRLLDNLGAPAAIIVDCARLGQNLLKSCALYYYDRVAKHVIASAVKEFTAGANDATLWAQPMVKNLDDGIAASQRERDQAMIDELVARKEDDDSDDIHGVISIFGQGDRMRLGNSWSQTVAGGGFQLGFLRDGIGVVGEIGRLSWTGDGVVKSAQRTNYGLNMEFRAKALESLLWLIEIGGGKEESKFVGSTSDDFLTIQGVYANIRPGVGLEVSENFSMDLALSWRWFFEQSTSQGGSLTGVNMSASNTPGLALRATLIL